MTTPMTATTPHTGRERPWITAQSAVAVDEHVLPLGWTESGTATADLDVDRHVLMVGPSAGTGKTAAARALAVFLLAHGWGAVITGPGVATAYGRLSAWPNVHVREPDEAAEEDLPTLIRAEVMRRAEIARSVRASHRELIREHPRRYFRPLVVIEDGDTTVGAAGLARYCGAVAVHVIRIGETLDQVDRDREEHRHFTTQILTAPLDRPIDSARWADLFSDAQPPNRPGAHLSFAGELAAPRPLILPCSDRVDLDLAASAGLYPAAVRDHQREARLAEALGTRGGAVAPAPRWLGIGGAGE